LISPDDEIDSNGVPLLFVTRFNKLVDALIVESSVKLVARCAVDYAVRDGEGIYPGNEQIARKTSLTAESVRKAWGILRALGMAELDAPSVWTGSRRLANAYSLAIPARWHGFPVYGPHFGRFTCQHCGHLYNPQPGTVLNPDGSIAWYLRSMVFCRPPARPKRPGGRGRQQPKPPGCSDLWGQHHSWPGGEEAWGLFRKARNDEWGEPRKAEAA